MEVGRWSSSGEYAGCLFDLSQLSSFGQLAFSPPPVLAGELPQAWFFRACWGGRCIQNKVIFVGSLLAPKPFLLGWSSWNYNWNMAWRISPNHDKILLILDGKLLANQLTWWLCHFFARRFNLLGGGLIWAFFKTVWGLFFNLLICCLY